MEGDSSRQHSHPASVDRTVSDRGPINISWSDQIRNPAAAPQKEEVLAGTGLVEAGTYIAILAGTIIAGPIAVAHTEWAAVGIIVTAIIGYLVSRQVPSAPPLGKIEPLDWNIWRASVKLIKETMHVPEVYYAILAISFFWTIGAVAFHPVPAPCQEHNHGKSRRSKPVLGSFLGRCGHRPRLRSMRCSKGRVSARYSPISVIFMGLFVIAFYFVCKLWQADQPTELLGVTEFLAWPMATVLLLCLLGISVAGGMFVVPLYAFLTTPRLTGKSSAYHRCQQYRPTLAQWSPVHWLPWP